MNEKEQQPIMEFESEAQAQKCLKEWQRRLFLQDWIIKLNINVSPNVIGEGLQGKNNFIYPQKTSVISIVKPDEDTKTRIAKHCAECTLIHELLHCKYNILENSGTYEGTFLDVHQHMLLEQMAKSLLMAKYNLDNAWFKNF